MSTLLVVLSTLLAVVSLEALAFLVVWRSPRLLHSVLRFFGQRQYDLAKAEVAVWMRTTPRTVIPGDEPTQL
jgi:hypothetical protein